MVKPPKEFLKEIIEAYRCNKMSFQPEYTICFAKWIIDNKCEKETLGCLLVAEESHFKDRRSIEALETRLLQLHKED